MFLGTSTVIWILGEVGSSIPALNHNIPKKFPLALGFLPITEMKVKIAYNTFDTGKGFWEGITPEKLSVFTDSFTVITAGAVMAWTRPGRQHLNPWSCRGLCVIYGRNFSLVVVRENCSPILAQQRTVCPIHCFSLNSLVLLPKNVHPLPCRTGVQPVNLPWSCVEGIKRKKYVQFWGKVWTLSMELETHLLCEPLIDTWDG